MTHPPAQNSAAHAASMKARLLTACMQAAPGPGNQTENRKERLLPVLREFLATEGEALKQDFFAHGKPTIFL
ncbi:MAG: hypothetical protein K2Q01_03875, partial [Rickettsiales bacterium]|nr:hypothetical protein [Rickettsiales bacterium]